MAKERIQVRQLPGPAPLAPRATPVDTFHRPDEKLLPQGPSQMQQLASALGKVAPSLFATADIQHAEETNRQMSEGELAILADKRLQNRKAFKAAVDSGEIPAARNPWFLKGMRQQVYRIEGEKFDRSLREQYANSESRNLDDISDFVSSFTSTYMKEAGVDPADPESASIFTPMVERSTASLLSNHRQERDRALELKAYQNTDIEIGLTLEYANEQGYGPDFAATSIQGVIDEHIKNGLDGTQVNTLTAHSVASKAIEKLDTSYLDVLDHISAGSGKLGQISAVKEIRAEAERSIHSAIEARDRLEHHQGKAEKEASIEALKSQAVLSSIDDPTADIKPILRQLAVLDSEQAQKVSGWHEEEIKRAQSDHVIENDEVAATLTDAVYRGEGHFDAVLAARRQGLISRDTMKDLLKNIERSKDFRSTLRDPGISELHKKLGEVIKGSDTTFKAADAVNAMRAQNAFLKDVNKYKASHPDDDAALTEYALKRQEQLLKIFAAGAVEDATSGVELTPNAALLAPAESVPWDSQPIFDEATLIEMATEYDNNRGESGYLVTLARHLGVAPADILDAQTTLSSKAKAAAKPKPTK